MSDDNAPREAMVSATSEIATADRLTLIAHAEWIELEQPIFVQKGERYWVDRQKRSLVVEDSEGGQRWFAAKPTGPDTRR